MSDAPATPQKLTLTSGAGGPVLIATGLFALFLIVYFVAPALSRVKNRPPGDGSDPSTYGFVLDGAALDEEYLVAAQLHRDLVRSLDAPKKWKAPPLWPSTARISEVPRPFRNRGGLCRWR